MADKVMKFKIEATDNASPAFARLATAVDKAKQKLDELDRKKADPKITVDSTAAQTRVQALRDALAELKNQRVRVDVDMGTAKADVGELRQQMAFLRDVNVRVRVNTGSAKTEVTSIRNRLQQLSDTDVRVDLNSAGAEGKLNRLHTKIGTLRQLSPVRIDIQLDGDQHALDRLTALQTAASALAATRPNIQVTADTAAALAQLTAVHARLGQIAGQNHHIRLDTNQLTVLGELARIQTQLNRLGGGRIRITADTRALMVDLADARRRLNELKLMNPSPQVTADTAIAEQRVRDLELQLFRIAARQYDAKVNVKVDADKALGAIGKLTKALTLAGAGVLALGALPSLASLGASLTAAAGSAWLLPGALAAGATGFLALKIATSGFGEALKNLDDPAKFAESVKGLAPAARDTAVAVRDLKPAFDALRLDVQGRLFDGLGTSVRQLGTTHLPILRETYGQIATAANSAAKDVAGFLTSARGIESVKAIGAGAVTTFQNLAGTAKPLTSAFLDISAVGSTVLGELTAGAGAATSRFAAFIAEARRTGELEKWIRSGVTALGQLGSVAGNVGGILGGVFRAAQTSGADFLSTLQRVTGEMRNWVNSAQGQETLANAFRAIREAVDAAWPGVQAIGSALADLVNKIATSGALTQLGEAFTKLAQTVGPMASALGGLVISAIGPLASALGSLAPILGPVAVGLAGVWAAAKLMTGITAITPLISGFVTALKTAGTTAASGGLMAGLKTLAGSLGAGGILGVALGTAGAALGIWASSQADAAQKVAQHQAAVSDLAGTLDKYTGASTAATRAKVADQVATMKLKDGTTSFGDALRDAGIRVDDFVDATSGNQAKLEQLNGTLHNNARTLIQNSDAWKGLSDDAKAYPGALDLITDAALGNVQAQEKLAQITGKTGIELQAATAGAYGVVGPLGEIGSQLGAMSGKLAEAQKHAQESGKAMKSFGDTLDALKGGLGGIKDGVAPTALMAAGLKDLTAAASAAAAEAGKNKAEWGGLAEGAAAAEKSMADSRTAFIQTARDAGMAEDAAVALANQMGLIPSAARTIFETNATGVQAELITLGAQIAAVPGAKQVTISTLSEAAEKQLETFGIKVKHLEDGRVSIDLQDADAQAKFQAFMTTLNTSSGAPKIDLNTAPATERATALKTYMDGIVGMAKADADASPGTAKANELKSHIDGITAIMKAGADTSPGTQAGNELQAHISSLVGIMTADANNAPGTAKGDAMRSYITGLIAIMTADANAQPGTQKGDQLKGYIDKLNAAIKVGAVDNATPVIDNAARDRTATIYVKSVVLNQPAPHVRVAGQQQATGGILQPMAQGGVLGMASGGTVRPLRPMSSRIAQVIAPNTWRVMGDRMVDDEAFIPINQSARSLRILAQTAGRMGYGLSDLARGRAGMTIDDFARGSGVTRLDVTAQPARQHGVAAAVAAGMRAATVQASGASSVGMRELRGEIAGLGVLIRRQVDTGEALLRSVTAIQPSTINVHSTAADPIEVAREAQLRGRFSPR